MIGGRKIFDILPLHLQFSPKTLRKVFTYNLIYLIEIYFSVLSAVNITDISSTCNSPRQDLILTCQQYS